MASAEDPDAELVRRVREGNRAAFNQLVLKYRNRVMGVAVRMLGDRAAAEDLAQDVFVKVYRSIHNFNGEALFSTWLYRVTANGCLNHKRRQKRERRLQEEADAAEQLTFDPFSNPHCALERKQLKAALERAIQSLPQEQKMVLILRDIEGLSYEEIAACLDVELGTVRSRLHRARAALQAAIKMLCPSEAPRSVAL